MVVTIALIRKNNHKNKGYIGAGEEIRTLDIFVGNEVLYH